MSAPTTSTPEPASHKVAPKEPSASERRESSDPLCGRLSSRFDWAKFRRFLIPALLAIVLALATKAWALVAIELGFSRPVTDFLNLVLVRNQGAAFSLFSGDGPGQGLRMAALALVSMLPLIWFYRQAAFRDRALLIGLGFVLGGGVGNIHDRLRYGAVVDFLDFHLGEAHWPAFNLADVAVCLGAGLLAAAVIFGRQPSGWSWRGDDPSGGRDDQTSDPKKGKAPKRSKKPDRD